MDLEHLFELDALALESIKPIEKKRFHWDILVSSQGRPFIALLGPRGAGKTILLRQLRATFSHGIYISCDTLDPWLDIFELIKILYQSYGITHVLLDEIHFIHNFPSILKKVYDFLPTHLWLTSSSALSLVSSGFDLSRRVEFHTVTAFSYREYLWFAQNQVIPPLPLKDALSQPLPPEVLRAGRHFHRYLQGGLYPFMLEPGTKFELFRQILQKILTVDIPRFDRTVSTQDIDTMGNLVRFLGSSAVDGISYSSLSRNLAITKYMAQRYVSLLEKSFILKVILPKGTSVTREPKILLHPPYRLLFGDVQTSIGALREEFFVMAMEQHNQSFRYAKSTRGAKTPDYVLDLNDETYVVEIGGLNKGRSQFKEVEYSKKIVLYDAGLVDNQMDNQRATQMNKEPIPGVQLPLFTMGFG